MSKKPKFKLGPSKYPHVLRAVQSGAYIVPNTPISLLPDPQNQAFTSTRMPPINPGGAVRDASAVVVRHERSVGIDFLAGVQGLGNTAFVNPLAMVRSWSAANGSSITEARPNPAVHGGNANQEINNLWVQEATHEPERAQKYHFITWKDVLSYCDRIYQSIFQSGYRIDAIMAIPKGGFIPARILSEMFKEIPIYSYNQELPKQFFMQQKTCMIVDDICDSGATFQKIMNTRQPFSYYTCAVVMRSGSGISPKFVGYTHNGPEWIVFPWERMGINEILGPEWRGKASR